MTYREEDSTEPPTKIHKVLRAKSSKKKKKKRKSPPKRGGVGFVPDLDDGVVDGGMIGESHKTESRPISEASYLARRLDDAMSGALGKRSEKKEEEDDPIKKLVSKMSSERCANAPAWAGTRESDPWKDCPDRYKVDFDGKNQDSSGNQGGSGLEQSTTRPDGTPVVPGSDPSGDVSGGTTRSGDGAGGGTNITNQGTVVGAQGVDNQVGNINTGNIETAYQSQPIGNLDPVGDTVPANKVATPSASYNPPVSGGMVSPSGGFLGMNDPRKRQQPRASSQFQIASFDYNTTKTNFMRESSVKSLLDDLLNEKNIELNLNGSFGDPVRDKKEEDLNYIRAALFNSMKSKKK